MGQDSVARVEREPEILAAAVCGADRAAGEGRDEAGRTAGVTAYRAGVQDLDVADRGADRVRLESATDHLDPGQLGPSGSGRSVRGGHGGAGGVVSAARAVSLALGRAGRWEN